MSVFFQGEVRKLIHLDFGVRVDGIVRILTLQSARLDWPNRLTLTEMLKMVWFQRLSQQNIFLDNLALICILIHIIKAFLGIEVNNGCELIDEIQALPLQIQNRIIQLLNFECFVPYNTILTFWFLFGILLSNYWILGCRRILLTDSSVTYFGLA